MLNNKNILYIGVKFYHYHEAIISKLEKEYNAIVTFFPERDTSIIYGIINRLFPKYIGRYQSLYYTRILKKICNNKFDYFIVIRGFLMPIWFVKKVKEINTGIKTIYYQWDSNNNSPFINLNYPYNVIDEFDAKLSFDYKDVLDFPILKYCPTFYTDEIKNIGLHNDAFPIKYDLFYFGSYLPERYKGLINIISYAKKNNLKLKTYFYMPFRYYLIEKFKGTNINKAVINTKPMDRNTYHKLFSFSKCIIDVSNTNQTGMAMRVIDALGAGKKLITTNKWIFQDSAYNPDQVLFIDLDNIHIPTNFINSPIKNIKNIDFSLDNWINNIFFKSFS